MEGWGRGEHRPGGGGEEGGHRPGGKGGHTPGKQGRVAQIFNNWNYSKKEN